MRRKCGPAAVWPTSTGSPCSTRRAPSTPTYRGEIGVLLINLGQAAFTIEPGERIAQLVVAPYTRVEWAAVENTAELAVSERGAGGFGHTGTS